MFTLHANCHSKQFSFLCRTCISPLQAWWADNTHHVQSFPVFFSHMCKKPWLVLLSISLARCNCNSSWHWRRCTVCITWIVFRFCRIWAGFWLTILLTRCNVILCQCAVITCGITFPFLHLWAFNSVTFHMENISGTKISGTSLTHASTVFCKH